MIWNNTEVFYIHKWDQRVWKKKNKLYIDSTGNKKKTISIIIRDCYHDTSIKK